MQSKMRNKLMYHSEKDTLFDYCLYPYKPLKRISTKIKSVNLLFNIAKYLGYNASFFDLIAHIQNSIGIDRTVYGIKQKGKHLFLEFYFYNYGKKDPLVTMTNLKQIFEPFFIVSSKPNEHIKYFMFSIDVDETTLLSKKSQGFHVYLPLIEKRSGGYSYFLQNQVFILENHYEFFDAKTEKQEIVRKVNDSVFVDSNINLKEILVPELLTCKTICIAKKKNCDCIYFSRIPVEKLLFFLDKFGYPQKIIDFTMKHKPQLDHLLYDVGFDFYVKDKKIFVEKSGFYGMF